MAKLKTVYVCKNCGANEPKWVGQCSSCGEWNSFIEEVQNPKSKSRGASITSRTPQSTRPMKLDQIEVAKLDRIDVKNGEFNRVLGGGMVPGSLVLLGGEPGIGKSTLVLQVALAMNDKKVLYVSGEESLQQLKMRANRLGGKDSNCLFLSETALETILMYVEKEKPDLLIIDSIQTMATDSVDSSPGSVGQIRECTTAILKAIKTWQIPTLLIGHITKEGSLAGPKVLEHIVDTVLQFEGDRNHLYRIMRSIKNRFGSTAEMGIYEMQDSGLREVSNPSEMLIPQSDSMLSGTAISGTIEGQRSFMIEVQALVSSAAYGTPQRSSTGFDPRRLNMLLAVLEKRAGFKLMAKDVFLNIAGGIKVVDPAMDLGVIAAILSSNFDIHIDRHTAFTGEIGLTGEIRPVNRIEMRISEAEKLGFKEIYCSSYNKIVNPKRFKIQINQVNRIEQMIRHLFA